MSTFDSWEMMPSSNSGRRKTLVDAGVDVAAYVGIFGVAGMAEAVGGFEMIGSMPKRKYSVGSEEAISM
jgi:hypothetical protein